MAIALFTDFGNDGLYTGQMEAVIENIAPTARVIHLLNNAPTSEPSFSAYLLQAVSRYMPVGTIFLAVIDPGVGSRRKPVVVEADGQFFVGPDNGLFAGVAKQAKQRRFYEIIWQPDNASRSFHGRDIFAPVAARLFNDDASGLLVPTETPDLSAHTENLQKIIYLDHYGNAITGIRYHHDLDGLQLRLKHHLIKQASTFSDVSPGELFWYKNSLGLVEIAANLKSAQSLLNIQLGECVIFEKP
jgi:S-adenosylmethionine hydrolase